jgi:hypothetical protein
MKVAERYLRQVRAGEWWDSKMVPILFGFYASAIYLNHDLSSLWASAALLLASLIPGAIYVSVVNDLTDIEADAAAGKSNRMAGRSAPFRTVALALPLMAGGLFFWIWRDSRLLQILYGGAWIAFTLYSVPPVRLKTKGLAGVIADAAGAHLFPTLLSAALAFAAAGRAPEALWFGSMAAWSFAYGFRGNLWHQLLDRDSDRQAGLRTFGANHPPRVLGRVAAWFAFPLEALALAMLMWQLQTPLPPLLLIAYGVLVMRRVRLWDMRVVLAEPHPKYLILLHEYYDVFLPLALLTASAIRYPADLILIPVHLLFFHRRALLTWGDSWVLITRPALERLRLVRPLEQDTR